MFQLKNLIVNNVLDIENLILKANVISIEGQSGSGKSTLLRLLNNLDDATSGQIIFKNNDLMEIPPLELRKRIVMLPQNPVVFDGTIRDNLTIGLTLSGQPLASDKQLQHILKLLWVDKHLDTNANELSGGETQRMSLGRLLLMKEAEVFLLDEPSSDLDDKTTNHILGNFMQQAKETGQQIIMVTHDNDVTKRFADEVINMDTYSKQIQQGSDDLGE